MRQQRQKIKELLKRRPNKWIPLYEILQLGVAQYNARLFELRHNDNMIIENKTKVINGVKHSWYKYIPKENGQLLFM